MTSLNVDGLVFTFPAGWRVSKYDEWSFYRNQFSKQNNSIKAVDILAISPAQDSFLIEVKDYRHPDAEKPSELPLAIAAKVLHTLSAMLPAKVNANDHDEQQFAASFLGGMSLRVVAHIELPERHRPVVDRADLMQKLRSLLKAVDPHVKVVHMSEMRSLEWEVA